MSGPVYCTELPSPVGLLTLAGTEENLLGLWLAGQKYFLDPLPQRPERRDTLPLFLAVRRWLTDYFAGERPAPVELPLAPMGSDFRQRVWRQLLTIPYGTVTTYGKLARALDSSPRAVGGAVGHNPISIIIPCHRVIGATGSLTGYAGGLDRKRQLLEMEGVYF